MYQQPGQKNYSAKSPSGPISRHAGSMGPHSGISNHSSSSRGTRHATREDHGNSHSDSSSDEDSSSSDDGDGDDYNEDDSYDGDDQESHNLTTESVVPTQQIHSYHDPGANRYYGVGRARLNGGPDVHQTYTTFIPSSTGPPYIPQIMNLQQTSSNLSPTFNDGVSTPNNHPNPRSSHFSPSVQSRNSYLGFIPSVVSSNNPTLANAVPAGYFNYVPSNVHNANTQSNTQNTQNTQNNTFQGSAQRPPKSGKKPFRKPKTFYPAELFNQKRPSGVMEAYEVAKMAGPTKREKKAMGKAKLRKMKWPCPLCDGIFEGERHVRSHLRSRSHLNSAVRVNKETYKMWLDAWIKSGAGKKKKWKGKKKTKGKGKGKAKDNGKGKEKGKGDGKENKSSQLIPTAIEQKGPPASIVDTLTEEISSLGILGQESDNRGQNKQV